MSIFNSFLANPHEVFSILIENEATGYEVGMSYEVNSVELAGLLTGKAWQFVSRSGEKIYVEFNPNRRD